MEDKLNDKIKIIMLTNSLAINGVSQVIYNYCLNIDLDKFDVSVAAGDPIDSLYSNAFEKRGIKLIELPSRKQSTRKYYKALYKHLRSNNYDVFHVHGNSALVTPELFLAWRAGVKVRIAHSHNTTCSHKIAHKLLMPFFKLFCTAGFACGEEAGKWMFGNRDFTVIPNGFETEKFIFNADKRNEVRRELNIEDKFVIGHIGRFNNQKNHPFLLDVFEKVAAKRDDAVLLLVGNGPDYEMVCKRIAESKYKDRIIVYGESTDTPSLYSAMDMFVLPSKHEGLVIVLLEAQINGLYCLASDVITRETRITENIEYLSLAQYDEWVNKITDAIISDDREKAYKKHVADISKYNIFDNIEILKSKYIELYKGIAK